MISNCRVCVTKVEAYFSRLYNNDKDIKRKNKDFWAEMEWLQKIGLVLFFKDILEKSSCALGPPTGLIRHCWYQESRAVAGKPRNAVVNFDAYNLALDVSCNSSAKSHFFTSYSYSG